MEKNWVDCQKSDIRVIKAILRAAREHIKDIQDLYSREECDKVFTRYGGALAALGLSGEDIETIRYAVFNRRHYDE